LAYQHHRAVGSSCRSLLIQEATLTKLAKNGFALISVAEAELISDDPTRRAFQQMLGEFAKSQIA
jgi:hypothetical protein